MSNSMTTVFYCNDEIRTMTQDKEVWWSIIDICKVLEIANSRKIYARLDGDEKKIVPLVDSAGRRQEMQMVNEYGLYHILLTSRSPQAAPFRRWVTHEVIPNIRKHGYYKIPNDERRIIAYKSIAEAVGLPVEEIDSDYSEMPLYRLEGEVRKLEYQAKKKEEREAALKRYPYSQKEMDALCHDETEYLLYQLNYENDVYFTTLSTGEYLFSEKFKQDIPKLTKKFYGI